MRWSCVFGLLMVACSSESAPVDPQGTSLQAATSTYALALSTNPSPIQTGRPCAIDAAVTKGTATVTSFVPVHGENMHFIAISSDLDEIVHTHPTLSATGHFADTISIAHPQPYTVFAEVQPTGTATEQVLRGSVAPAGAATAPPVLTHPFMGSAKAVVVGTTQLAMSATAGHMVMPRSATHFTFAIQTLAGTPVSDLENWLGMPAHMIIVSSDMKTFIHAHAMPDMGGGDAGMDMDMDGGMDMDAGPVPAGALGVDVTFPKSGLYKAFIQFQRSGALITVPLPISVM